jgi:hypothetical protein
VLGSAVIGCNHDGVGAIVEVVDLMLSRLTLTGPRELVHFS